MNALFEPARAGFVVFACLLAACSGATETETGTRTEGTSGTYRTGGENGTVAAPTPSASGSGTPSAPTSDTSSDPAPSGEPSGGGGGASGGGGGSGTALCGPDEVCHGISSCSNTCYGPNCCYASCQCADIHSSSARLVCSLSCPK